jgi:hypothetical protein
LCVGALVLLALVDRGIEIDGSRAALARVLEAMNRMPVMHEVYQTRYDGPPTHQTEIWYDFNSRTALAKYATDGQYTKINLLNYTTMEEVVYDPKAGVVRIVYRCDVAPDGYPDSPAQVAQDYLDLHGSRGARFTRERSQYHGTDADVYQSRIESNERRHKEQATLVVDRRTNLPLAMTRTNWTQSGAVTFDQTMTFDFPATGPRDIYEIGAPRSAQVVLDEASKERYEKKRSLEQRIPPLTAAIEGVYRLTEGQALVLIPPLSAQPRLEWERTQGEIRRLEDEQVRERLARSGNDNRRQGKNGRDPSPGGQSPPHYQCFVWDAGIDLHKSRPVFIGPVSLKEALERIVELSAFDYEIARDLTDVNIPGDWVVRKGSSKEQRLAAFEKIVRESTGRAIVFRESRVERDVIVARGTFRFQPPAGTYNRAWIHVYADRLDPDTRGGGGSGSLARFVRRLGEVTLNRQVIDETEGDRDGEVHYGWHESGYIRKITDEKERAAKLQMVLDNVSRQTGLTFTIERRTVATWHIVETQQEVRARP